MKKRYEGLKAEINRWNENDVLTESAEPVFLGDGWVKDPFQEK